MHGRCLPTALLMLWMRRAMERLTAKVKRGQFDYGALTWRDYLCYYVNCWRTRRNLRRRRMNGPGVNTQAGRVGMLLVDGQAEKFKEITR